MENLEKQNDRNEAVIRNHQALEIIRFFKENPANRFLVLEESPFPKIGLYSTMYTPEQIGGVEMLDIDDPDTQTKLADFLSRYKIKISYDKNGGISANYNFKNQPYSIL